MLRKDGFMDILATANSTETINTKLKDLEIFIDGELNNINNIIKFINSTSASTSGGLLDNLETVDIIKYTDIVHRDTTVTSTKKIAIGDGSNSATYSFWSESLIYPNQQPATTTPWNDKVIAQTAISTFTFDGKLRITCPENTNKYVAKTLANKYMGNDGFWSISNKPNVGNNSKNANNKKLSNAVIVLYDLSSNTVYMEFKIF